MFARIARRAAASRGVAASPRVGVARASVGSSADVARASLGVVEDGDEKSLNLDELLARKRERRRRARAIDRDGGLEAFATARTVDALHRAALETSAVSAAAALAALRSVDAADARDAFEGEGGKALAAKLRDAFESASGTMSLRALARAFHDSARARFDAPATTLLRAAAARIEREREASTAARDVTSAIWGVENYWRRRDVREDSEDMRALREFARVASAAAASVFVEWDSAKDKRGAATLCRALKHVIAIHKITREPVPMDFIASLVNVASHNAVAFSPMQVSFILHDVVSAKATDILTERVIASFSHIMQVDESTPFAAVSALLWSYAKMDALKSGLVSTKHTDELHFVTRAKLDRGEKVASRDIAMNMYAVARLGAEHVGFADGDYHDVACKTLAKEIDTLNQRALLMISWSLNTMRPSEDNVYIHSTFLDALGGAVQRSVHAFAPFELAPTMHALTSLRVTNPKLLELARDRFRADVSGYAEKPQNLTLMLWSFAAAEYDIGEDTSRMAAYAYLDVAPIASALETKTILQSLARLHFVFDEDDARVKNILDDVIERYLDEYSEADCEVLAWSLLALRVPASERLLERVGVESVANDAGDVEYVVHKPIDV